MPGLNWTKLKSLSRTRLDSIKFLCEQGGFDKVSMRASEMFCRSGQTEKCQDRAGFH